MRTTRVMLLQIFMGLILAGSTFGAFWVYSRLQPQVQPNNQTLRISTDYPDPLAAEDYTRRLKQDLMGKPWIIPYDGVLGGTMGFHTVENIFILSERWVYARFEDGHIAGDMLLEYRIHSTGEIVWEILHSSLL
ncbi:MAG: hypothetical protein ACOCVC_05245 [Spirochaeta sp.]